jgi:hypothetical protein
MSELQDFLHGPGLQRKQRRDVMERRQVLNFTIALITGAAALAVSAQAAPLPPAAAQVVSPSPGHVVDPAVVSQDEVDRLQPQQVRWGHHHWHHHHWHHRHWGWHRHHWHHRHWGWHHRHWHHRHWW